MDFYRVKEREAKKGILEVYPDFQVTRSDDLMVRGKAFYAMWDESLGLWTQDEYDVPRLVDQEIQEYTPQDLSKWLEIHRKFLGNYSTSTWLQFRNYLSHLSNSSTQLDEKLTFANTEVTKKDYVSKRLPYSLAAGDISAWDELVSTLYKPEDRAKIEWAIGCVIAGDSTTIQKFLVFYGPGGTGKSTVINIIQMLFEGYVSTFDAKALTGNNNSFATEVFRENPLVAIQHDGDLSKIEDNTKLNSIVSHEIMTINEKFKSSYDMRPNAFLIMGTNKAVKITDAKSGLIRRLIDVHPTGERLAPRRYQTLMTQITFELGAIAQHCLDTYLEMGKNFYDSYRPTEMMLQTDVFYNFIEAEYDVFSSQEGITLKQAYALYKEFSSDTGLEYLLPQYKFREELRNYFETFIDRYEMADGTMVRSWYTGFKADKFKVQVKDEMVFSLVLDESESLFDKLMARKPAQYANAEGNPRLYWTNKPKPGADGKEFIPRDNQVVSTTLSDINTHKEHYVKVPITHIVIDFDLTDENGEKSLEKNLEAASQWPPTYAELSKSGSGVHLHYDYEGDPLELSLVYEPGIEVKVYKGDTALRRKLTQCNNIPVAKMPVGALPKKEKKVTDGSEGIKSEKGLRDLIARNLRKEIHAGTKPSMDFIHHILEEAYNKQEFSYDVSDMRQKILAFANNSSHQALYCIKLMQSMKFKSDDVDEPQKSTNDPLSISADDLVFWDVEVFPNLFVVCYKMHGKGNVVRMINPTPQQIEELLPMKLVGFNNRRYDNHIMYGRYMGYSLEQLYKLSQKIIEKSANSFFGEAYNLSYTDIYDFSSATNKKSLKRWQIELGLNHQELGLPWDEPVPEELWMKVADYCANDVETTEQVFDHLQGDWKARQILSAISGLSVNETTNRHSTKIMFGDERHPQREFEYTHLADMFPGYKFDLGKSEYRGEITGEGGYVYAEPGMYNDVIVLDVASMHPTSIEQLNLFGTYTKQFSEIKNARVQIKRSNFEAASQMMEGKLAPFLNEGTDPKALGDALKTVINSVYGLTSASFENAFKDPRNIDNIVAKRGALFMIDLKYAVQELGWQVIHIKTDSIKIVIPEGTDKKTISDFVMDFGEKFGYEFEVEGIYAKICLVNDAVFIGQKDDGKNPLHWEAVGAQFAHPFVFKTLFSHEPIKFEDKCETKQVTTSLWLDFGSDDDAMALQKRGMVFVGRAGSFCPILPGKGGGQLMREKDGKFYAANGSKGYLWMEADMVKTLSHEKDIDLGYFRKLVDEAIDDISSFGNFEEFVSESARELVMA